jgi:hypothetical protein
MSDDYQRIELITGTARRRRRTTEQNYASSRRATRRGVAGHGQERWVRKRKAEASFLEAQFGSVYSVESEN